MNRIFSDVNSSQVGNRAIASLFVQLYGLYLIETNTTLYLDFVNTQYFNGVANDLGSLQGLTEALAALNDDELKTALETIAATIRDHQNTEYEVVKTKLSEWTNEASQVVPTYDDAPGCQNASLDREHAINWVTDDSNCNDLKKYINGTHSADNCIINCTFWMKTQLLLGSYVKYFNTTFIKSPANRSEYRVLTKDMEREYEKYKAYLASEKYYLHFYDTEELLYALNLGLIRAARLFFYQDGATLDQQLDALARTLRTPGEIAGAMDELVGSGSVLDDLMGVLGVSVSECPEGKSAVKRLAAVRSVGDDIRTVVEGCFRNARLFFAGYSGVPQLVEVGDLL